MLNKLLLATNNPGKIAELKGMFAGLDIELLSLADFPETVEVDETGSTLAANARLKAIGYAQQTGMISLADDSGLEIAALGGRPGVLSARYGGEYATFARKMEMLLDELNNTGASDRSAQFVCSIAVASPDGAILFESEGVCTGQIAVTPMGTGGFGYDPLFIPDGYDETFGQLSDSVKQKVGHRGNAFLQIIPFLQDFIEF